MPKVSVIIPVYNVEKYLEECLDSIINQSLEDIEIICINDGSTDNSGKIVDRYANKDKRIKVFHCKNQGAAAARNFGFEKSCGEYVLFFDSDDYMSINALETLYNKASNSDITICESQKLEQESGKITSLETSLKTEYLNGKQVFAPKEVAPYIFQFCIGWAWDKLYRREFVPEKKIKFQEIRHSNDTFFVLFSLTQAEKISIADKVLITHREHKTSLAATRNKNPECFYFALRQLYLELKKSGNYELFEQSFINYCIAFSQWHIQSVTDKSAKEVMKKYYKRLVKLIELKKYSEDYFYDKMLYHLMNALINTNLIRQAFYKTMFKLFKRECDLVNYYGDNWFANFHKLLTCEETSICLWGASLFLEEFILKNKIKNPKILGIIDKNSLNQGKQIGEYKVFAPDKLKELKPEKVILTVLNNHEIIYEDVKKYLNDNYPEIKLLPDVFLS